MQRFQKWKCHNQLLSTHKIVFTHNTHTTCNYQRITTDKLTVKKSRLMMLVVVVVVVVIVVVLMFGAFAAVGVMVVAVFRC